MSNGLRRFPIGARSIQPRPLSQEEWVLLDLDSSNSDARARLRQLIDRHLMTFNPGYYGGDMEAIDRVLSNLMTMSVPPAMQFGEKLAHLAGTAPPLIMFQAYDDAIRAENEKARNHNRNLAFRLRSAKQHVHDVNVSHSGRSSVDSVIAELPRVALSLPLRGL